MKRILLITAVLFTSILSAQDWAPFKASDTLVQFKDTTVSSFQGTSQFTGNYIHSLVVKSKSIMNTDTIIVFKKGFSNRVFNHLAFPPANQEYLIKGRLLGDTAFINSVPS